MNILNFYVKLYGSLYNRKGIHYRVFSPARYVVRKLANWQIPRYLRKHPCEGKGAVTKDLIVSFTSFPARIDKVWMVVECLKRQSVLPEKMILWLSKEQFPTYDSIPQSLQAQVDDLFEIRMVDGDLRSHKKYYYAACEYPNKTIVTCDDDVFYHPDILLYLLKAHKKYPHCVIANITRQMSFTEKGELQPYTLWKQTLEGGPSPYNVQIGVGGVLYPPHSLSELLLRKDLFLSLAPLADDLWLHLMARLKETQIVQSSVKILPLSVESDSPQLKAVNMGVGNMNDKQIIKIRDWLHREDLSDVYRLCN